MRGRGGRPKRLECSYENDQQARMRLEVVRSHEIA